MICIIFGQPQHMHDLCIASFGNAKQFPPQKALCRGAAPGSKR